MIGSMPPARAPAGGSVFPAGRGSRAPRRGPHVGHGVDGRPLSRISKCRCGTVDGPVLPTRPMTCPRGHPRPTGRDRPRGGCTRTARRRRADDDLVAVPSFRPAARPGRRPPRTPGVPCAAPRSSPVCSRQSCRIGCTRHRTATSACSCPAGSGSTQPFVEAAPARPSVPSRNAAAAAHAAFSQGMVAPASAGASGCRAPAEKGPDHGVRRPLPLGIGGREGADLHRLCGRPERHGLPARDAEQAPLPAVPAGVEHRRRRGRRRPLRRPGPARALLEQAQRVAVAVVQVPQGRLLQRRHDPDGRRAAACRWRRGRARRRAARRPGRWSGRCRSGRRPAVAIRGPASSTGSAATGRRSPTCHRIRRPASRARGPGCCRRTSRRP